MKAYPIKDFVFACEYDPFVHASETVPEHAAWLRDCGVNQVHIGRGMWALCDLWGQAAVMDKCLQCVEVMVAQGMAVVVSAGTDISPVKHLGESVPKGSSRDGFMRARREWLAALHKALAGQSAIIGWEITAAEIEALSTHAEITGAGAFRKALLKRFGDLDGLNQTLLPHFRQGWCYDLDALDIPTADTPLPLRIAYGEFCREQTQAVGAALVAEWLALDADAMLYLPSGLVSASARSALILPFVANSDRAGDAPALDNALMSLVGSDDKPAYLLSLQTAQSGQWPDWHADPQRMQNCVWSAFVAGARGIHWPELSAVPGCATRCIPLLPSLSSQAVVLAAHLRECREHLPFAAGELADQPECALLIPSDVASIASGGPAETGALLEDYRQAFRSLAIPCADIDSDSDLASFKALFAPVMPCVAAEWVEKLIAFVERGGLLVTGFGVGGLDRFGLVPGAELAQALRRLLGLSVQLSLTCPEPEALSIRMGDGRIVKAGYRSESLHLRSASALAHYSNGPFAGTPALAVHSLGRGQVYYLGMRPKASFYRYALADLADRMDLRRPPLEFADGVELQSTRKGDTLYYRFFNSLNASTAVEMKSLRGTDVLSGKACRGRIVLAAGERLLVRVNA